MADTPGYLSNAELAAGVQVQTDQVKQFKDEQTNLYTTSAATASITDAEGVARTVPSWNSLNEQIGAAAVGQGSGMLGYATKAGLDADLAHADGTMATVTNDPTPANNGAYRKSGASGSGSWILSADRVSALQATTAKNTEDIANTTLNVARLPSSLSVPNLFSLDEINIKGLPNLLLVTGALAPTPDHVGQVPCWTVTTNAGDASNSVRFAFDASKFAGSKIAASTEFLYVTPVGSAINVYLQITQHAANGATLASTQVIVCGAEGVTSAKTIAIQPIDKADGVATVRLVISVSNSGGARTLKFRNLSISSGIAEFSMPPAQIPKVSIFPDPGLTGNAATTSQWTPDIEDGERILTASGTGTLQQIWSIPKSLVMQSSDLVVMSAEIFADVGNASDLTLIQYDADGVEISRLQANQTDAGNYQLVSTSLRLAANMARVDCRLVKRAGATSAKMRRPTLTTTSNSLVLNAVNPPSGGSGSGRTILHIDATSGDDVSDGISAPVKSFTRAMQLAGPDTLMLVADGDYTDAPIMGSVQSLEVRALRNAHVRLVGGTKITTAVATSGKVKTYQVARGASPSGWLFYHDVPEPGTLISDAERLPQQGGRQYRLPMTRIWPVASLDAIDASDEPSWYWESGVLYFSVPDGQDANGGVYIPSASAYPFSGGSGGQSVRAVGLQSFYWEKGFGPSNCAEVELIDCRSYGALVDGFAPDDCRFVRLVRCEAGGNNNDGAGGHQTDPATVLENAHYVGDNCWYHDNWDDGESFHEGWTATDNGALVEYNGDRGIVTANGGHSSHYNVRARSNGQNTGASTYNGGAGFCCAGTATDGGVGTQMELYGCISEGNPINYSVNGVNKLDAYQCTSLNPGATHYMQSGGTLNLIDCRYSGSGTVKSGTINVAAGSPVT